MIKRSKARIKAWYYRPSTVAYYVNVSLIAVIVAMLATMVSVTAH